MARLEEVHHGKGISKSSGLSLLPISSFCSSFVAEDVISRLPAPGAFCLTSLTVMDHHFEILSPNQHFLPAVAFVGDIQSQ